TNDGTLYIADRSNHRVVVVYPNSTIAGAIIGSGYGNGLTQMNFPSDVFVTSDGIYVLDSSNYRVLKWWKNATNSSIVAGMTGVMGSTSSNATFSTTYGLFVDDLGYIYVSDAGNYRVIRFPPNSTSSTIGSTIAGTGLAGYGRQGLDSSRGIFVNSDGALYIADTNNHRIQKWNSGACYGVTTAGTGYTGNSLGQLQNPSSVVVDSNGYMYISDQNNHRVLRWAPEACAGECIAGCSMTIGTRPDQLFYPFSIAFDSQGSLYVSDTSNNRVQKFAILNNTEAVLVPTAQWVTNATTVAGSPTGGSGSTSSLLSSNYGIRITNDGTLYIADRSNHRVVVVYPNSTIAGAIIGSGYGNGLTQMNSPSDVFVTSDGIYVLDSSNYRVLKLQKNGTNPTIVAGSTGVLGTTSSYNTFGASYQMFIDISGNIYVSDQSNHRVLRFPPNSSSGTNANVIAGIGSSGYGPSQLNTPYGIFVDSARTLYIADTNNHRIQRWKYNACSGTTVAGRAGQTGSALYLLQYPSSVVVDINGYIYICDKNNNRVLRWAPEACAGECTAGCSMTIGTRPDQLFYPFSVAFDSQGSLYVSDTSNNRVQKFSVFNNVLPTTDVTTMAAAVSTSSIITSILTSEEQTPVSSTATSKETTALPSVTTSTSLTSMDSIKTSLPLFIDTTVVPTTEMKTSIATTNIPKQESTMEISTMAPSTVGTSTTTIHSAMASSTALPSTMTSSTATMQSTATPSTTVPSTMASSTTVLPSAMVPSTAMPSTMASSTAAMQSTATPPTTVPSTMASSTTVLPSTMVPSTAMPSTMASSTAAMQSTATPSTTVPSTMASSITVLPSTMVPSTAMPSTMVSSTTVLPSIMLPSTMVPSAMVISTMMTSLIVPLTMEISTATSMTPFTIEGCSSPIITLTPSNPLSRMPWYHQRDQSLSISSIIQLNCPKSLLTRIQWTIYACQPLCSFQIEMDPSVTIMTLSELFLPSRSLHYGLYKIKLTVTMQILPQLTSSEVTYISIIPSPITVNLIRFGSSMISIGRNQTLILDPGSFSLDPDEVIFDANNWNYIYYCRISPQSNFMQVNSPFCFGNRSAEWYYGSNGIQSSLIIQPGLFQTNQTYQLRADLINIFNASRIFTGYLLVKVEETDSMIISIRYDRILSLSEDNVFRKPTVASSPNHVYWLMNIV
ncbi:unnamed protein product, partial [Rotaria sp. Silwood2]